MFVPFEQKSTDLILNLSLENFYLRKEKEQLQAIGKRNGNVVSKGIALLKECLPAGKRIDVCCSHDFQHKTEVLEIK